MTVAYCDCFSGISGDMFLAALIDAGVPLSHLLEKLAALNLPDDIRITATETHKGTLRACNLEVMVEGDSHVHRYLADILNLIAESRLSETVKRKSQAVFNLLGQAEARVHGVDVAQVHFHEVGALDSIVDIIGVIIGLEFLGVDQLYASPLPYGSGQVSTQHGILPLPAPATLELARLAGIPLIPSSAHVELVTPTGAALLGALAQFTQPALIVNRVGLGAGKRDLPWPNVLRLLVGESRYSQDTQPIILLETNIDDMNPQIYGHVMDRLFKAGALDVYLTPVYMKKNRPGVVLAVIARQQDEHTLAQLMLTETTTLGVRVQPMRRYEAGRSFRTVTTAYGQITLKLKILDDRVVQAVPEYDECARLAVEKRVPFATIYAAAWQEGMVILGHKGSTAGLKDTAQKNVVGKDLTS